jgi:hypothetical protein
MATKVRVKPVLPTEIKDKAIIAQVIKEIRRQPTPEQIARLEQTKANITRIIVR